MKKKPDFKKLALLGITGGIMLASEASAVQEPNTLNTQHLLAMGCGGSCGGKSFTAYEPRGGSCNNNQAPTYQNQGQSAPYGYAAQPQGYQPQGQPTQPPGYQPQGQPVPSNAQQAPSYSYQGQPAGCKSTSPQQGQRISAGCGGAAAPNYNNQPAQRVSAGCGGAKQRPNQQGTYSQWDQVADNGKGSASATYVQQGSAEDAQVFSQLNDEGKGVYRGLSPEGKALAQKLINQTCKGQNDCKGLNSCKSKDNSCAGKGSCKGTSAGPFKDKNEAVKVAAQKMAEKRASANSRY